MAINVGIPTFNQFMGNAMNQCTTNALCNGHVGPWSLHLQNIDSEFPPSTTNDIPNASAYKKKCQDIKERIHKENEQEKLKEREQFEAYCYAALTKNFNSRATQYDEKPILVWESTNNDQGGVFSYTNAQYMKDLADSMFGSKGWEVNLVNEITIDGDNELDKVTIHVYPKKD